MIPLELRTRLRALSRGARQGVSCASPAPRSGEDHGRENERAPRHSPLSDWLPAVETAGTHGVGPTGLDPGGPTPSARPGIRRSDGDRNAEAPSRSLVCVPSRLPPGRTGPGGVPAYLMPGPTPLGLRLDTDGTQRGLTQWDASDRLDHRIQQGARLWRRMVIYFELGKLQGY